MLKRKALFGLEKDGPDCPESRADLCKTKYGWPLGWDMGSNAADEGGGLDGEVGYIAKAITNAIVKKKRFTDPIQKESAYIGIRLRVLSTIAGVFLTLKKLPNETERDALLDLAKVYFVDIAKDKNANHLAEIDKVAGKGEESIIEFFRERAKYPIKNVGLPIKKPSRRETTISSNMLREQHDYGELDGEVDEIKRRLYGTALKVARKLIQGGVKGNEGGVLVSIRQILENNGLEINEMQDGVFRCTLDTSDMPKKNAISRMKSVRKQLDEQETDFNYLSDDLSMSRTRVSYVKNKNLKGLEFVMIFSPVFPKDEVSPKSLALVFSGVRRFLLGK